jgi:hypothetical protein
MLKAPATIVKTYGKESETARTQADLWNEEGEAREAQNSKFVQSLPAGTVQYDSALRKLEKVTDIQQRYLDRVAEYGNLGTVIFIWNNGVYTTFASDAMKAAIVLLVEGSAVDGVLQLDQTPFQARHLLTRAATLGYTVRRFNN